MGRTIIGRVSSDKPDKTIIITVDTRKTHPLYRKQYTMSKKFHAHDEQNEARLGDVVEIEEVPPISKHKTWKLKRVVERPEGAGEKVVG